MSWLRQSPKTAIPGGKPLRNKKPNGTGSTRVAGVWRMAALSLRHSKMVLGAAFRRTTRRKGAAVAVFAIDRRLAVQSTECSATATTMSISVKMSTENGSGYNVSRACPKPLYPMVSKSYHQLQLPELQLCFKPVSTIRHCSHSLLRFAIESITEAMSLVIANTVPLKR